MCLVIRGGAIKLIGKSCLIRQIILLKVRNLVRFKTMLLQSKKKNGGGMVKSVYIGE